MEAEKILNFYAELYKEVFAVPVIKGIKTEKEKFAGAEYTLSAEVFLPSGKVAQGATSHHLGQNFSKAFDIKFEDKDEKDKYVWQNSWGVSTRSIGIAIMMHSDNKGLVVSPRVADVQIVIIPIFDAKSKKKVMEAVEKVAEGLGDFRVEIDDRDFSPGFKFNDWEMKGVPLRIEIGPRELKAGKVVLVRRVGGKKESVSLNGLDKKIETVLEEIHEMLYKRAEKYLKDSIIDVLDKDELKKAIKDKKLARTGWCGDEKCEEMIKFETSGAKIAISAGTFISCSAPAEEISIHSL